MSDQWASENLRTIRTLMERSAVYRRALAPITLTIGIIGSVAACAGWFFNLSSPRAFVVFWMVVAVFCLMAALILMRRQALRDREPFWSPPTRRVFQALLPCLYSGVIAGGLIAGYADDDGLVWALVCVWMALYGCAIHAAGFFMPRGIKVLGWLFIGSGTVLLAALIALADVDVRLRSAHVAMGIFFGGAHLTYGAYLHFTKQEQNVS